MGRSGTPADGWLIRGGVADPQALLSAATDCLADNHFVGLSVWGMPGDDIPTAAARMNARYSKVRAVLRSTLIAAGYQLRTRRDGHVSVILTALTVDECQRFADLLEDPIPNPNRPLR